MNDKNKEWQKPTSVLFLSKYFKCNKKIQETLFSLKHLSYLYAWKWTTFLKGTVRTEIEILSSFTHPYVV